MSAVRQALQAFRRAPLLGGLSIITIGLSLLIIGLFALSAHNVDQALTGVEERVEIVGYLVDEAGDERIAVVQREIESYPEVDEVRYVSKIEALRNASRDLPEFSDVFSDLEVNPLPASLELRLGEGYRDPDQVATVAARLESYDFIEEVRFGQEWVERIFALRRIAGGGAVVLGGAFAIVAILLIGTSVRMAILARSEEIGIMQNVGASEAYIQKPFLVEGLITGVLGGLAAFGLTWLVYSTVNERFVTLVWLPDVWIVSGIAAAGLLGMIAAGYAVRRELGGAYAY